MGVDDVPQSAVRIHEGTERERVTGVVQCCDGNLVHAVRPDRSGGASAQQNLRRRTRVALRVVERERDLTSEQDVQVSVRVDINDQTCAGETFAARVGVGESAS